MEMVGVFGSLMAPLMWHNVLEQMQHIAGIHPVAVYLPNERSGKPSNLPTSSGKCTLPSHLSVGASDSITRILVVDPIKLMTIPEIRQHPWFQHHLPGYLAIPAIDVLQRVKQRNFMVLPATTRQRYDLPYFVCDAISLFIVAYEVEIAFYSSNMY
ncbi:SNF1-related protein kinase catalytic subunit alpha KIN10-like isoform X2 [Magnolia sinica]|uniref:SNF1-related protein kinase catalytic subunit alpha KIN10-like isoform X2 n=1 Tax=Magnolia sinica TaxID=86752 RepID=UPI002659B523|nr:SNF1-related protein kinase catalytic subunit alpha KIN10-like isoform X2 [Magnolia sinica]